MSGEIVVRAQTPERLTTDQIRYIANTDFMPKAYRGNVPAIMACVLTGRPLGLDDMHSIRSIYVVDGKATLSAELMATLSRKAGHSITGRMGDKEAVAHGRRGDNGDEMTVTWTMEMAQRAGLAGRGPWKQYPEAMLWARAVSQLCRVLFSDVLLGLAYTADEMGDITVDVPADGADTLPVLDAEVVVAEGSGGGPGGGGAGSPGAQGAAADTDEGANAVSSPPDTSSASPEEAPPTGDGDADTFTFESMVPSQARKGRPQGE